MMAGRELEHRSRLGALVVARARDVLPDLNCTCQ